MIKHPDYTKYAVVSCSGGMDSTCLLLRLLAEGHKVRTYSFDYGQAHNIEIKKAKKNIKYLQKLGFPVEHQVINVRDVFSGDTSTLVQHTQSPSGDYREETMKSTVVVNRNCIFSAIVFAKALSWAKQMNSPVVISLGIHGGDHSIYPDCRPESVEMARELYRISNWDSELVEYSTPFVDISKSDVLTEGLRAMNMLGFTKAQRNKVLKNTISCYNATPEGISCGTCGTCTERIEAFRMNGIKDPAPYSVDVDWTPMQ